MKSWQKFLAKLLVQVVTFFIEQNNDGNPVIPLSSINDDQSLFLQDVAKLISFAHTQKGIMLTGGELYRTAEQQAIYLAKGLTKVKLSQHQKRLAIDLNLFIDGVYQSEKEAYKFLSDYWKSLSPKNRSGYDWGWDANHFERTI
jgi:hypothetical protein